MASVSLVSSPPTPVVVLDKNMTDSELAEEEREDGELEDGEIDDEGIGIEEESKEEVKEVNEEKEEKVKENEKEKEKDIEKEDKTHRHSRKRYKKTREKRRSKRRRRDSRKHHSPSSSSSSDSYESSLERPERDRPKNKKNQDRSHRGGDYDGQSAQHGCDPSSGGHGNPQRSERSAGRHRSGSGDYDKYSDYSEDKYDYEGEGGDYDEEEMWQGKDSISPSQGLGRGRGSKDQMKRGGMKGMQKQQQQQFGGQRGRGRGGGVGGRGRGNMLNKNNKKQMQQMKGNKNWGRGRGRGGGSEQAGEGMKQEGGGKGPPGGFQKKRPIMTKEFINQHTVEHNGRYICKYFLEGRCIKGDQCKFEHELVTPDKKKELCKFYLQGYCSKGDNCIYMHSEYPCKFFHTGAKCYQGDNCKFSHDPLNDVTKDLLDKIINTEEEIAHEDEMELEDLRKQGIAPLPKPPPGVGLLPTPGPGGPGSGGPNPGPGPSSPQEGGSSGGNSGGKKIPSLFEIVVKPTVDLAQKIAQSGSNFNCQSGGQFQGDEFGGGGPDDNIQQSGPNGPPPVLPPGSPPGSMGGPSPPYPSHTGPPMQQLQNPPGQHPQHQPPHGFPMPPPPGPPPPFLGHRPNMNLNPNMNMNLQRPPPPFPPFPDPMQMLQNMNVPFQTMGAVGQNPAEFFNNFFRNQAQAMGQGDMGMPFSQNTSQQQGSADSQMLSQMQGLPPAVQKALLLHLQQQQGSEPQGFEEQGGKTPKDDSTNWYSSDDEDGNCVTAILKSLKKQNEKLQQGPQSIKHPSVPQLAPGDPRLQKERAPPSDPRMKAADPRQRPPDMRKEPDSSGGPRQARDPRKVRPLEPPNSFKPELHHHRQQQHHHNKAPAREEDEDGERELRERAALIPLDSCPGVMLRDPRCQLQQFSHIRVDVVLQRPAYASTVVWSAEDLIPSLVPKQEHSINLPLPPLIADAQMNRTNNRTRTLSPDHSTITTSTTPPHMDPRLVAARLKEGVLGVGVGLGRLPSRTLEPRGSTERLLDPRHHKALGVDPRIGRSGSVDTKLPILRETERGGGGGGGDPRLQRSSASGTSSSKTTTLTFSAPAPAPSKSEAEKPEKLCPYAPGRLSSSGGGLESSTTSTLLGGISLYDPRNQAPQQGQRDETEPPRKTGILKLPAKRENNTNTKTPASSSLSPTQRSGGSVSTQDVKGGTESAMDGSGSKSRPPPTLSSAPTVTMSGSEPPSSPVKSSAPAVHHLPIQALAGLIRPPYTDPRQVKQVEKEAKQQEEKELEEEKGEEEEKVEEAKEKEETEDDRPLKDVFKTFDPTASPFSQ
ncbi:zinc finger CCCH domain-containing protein 6 [Oncorhynchus clarkii lewisi]|uniref:zinc finger CCCH domain-containing protein 6 n=1 Tax=Oncorhynchus clarkii lewisi TaxID=490388 RepID=UPI0039B8A5BC